MARLVSAARFTPRDFGGSLRLDGADDRVTIAGITPSTTNFNVAIWVYWSDKNVLNSGKNLVSWTDANGGFSLAHLSLNTGKIRFEIKNGASAVAQIDSVQLSVGWHHIAATYMVNDARLYVDGVQVGTDTSCTMTAASQTFTVGRASNGTQPFIGWIDQFIFKNGTPWTQAEITDLYKLGIEPASSNCILRFNDGSGTTASDSSGNSNNGTIAGSAAFSTFVPSATRAGATGRVTASGRVTA